MIRFDPNLRVKDLESTIERLKRNIQREEPAIKRIFIEADPQKPLSQCRLQERAVNVY